MLNKKDILRKIKKSLQIIPSETSAIIASEFMPTCRNNAKNIKKKHLHGLQKLSIDYVEGRCLRIIYVYWGRRLIGISGSLIWSKTLMELIFNPCGEFRWSPEGPVSQIHSPHLHVGAPGIFSNLLRSVQMLKREWGAESNAKIPHLSIPSKTAAWVPEFAVEDLPLSRTAALVPEFAGTWWWWYVY